MPRGKSPNWGATGRPETFNDATLTRDFGVYWEEGTKRWQVVKLVDAVSAIGDVLYWKSYTSFTVTPTLANSSRSEVAGISEVVGVVNSAIAVRQSGLMNVKAEAVTFARGDQAVAFSANNSVTKITMANATYQVTNSVPIIGIAQAVESGGFVSLMLDIKSR